MTNTYNIYADKVTINNVEKENVLTELLEGLDEFIRSEDEIVNEEENMENEVNDFLNRNFSGCKDNKNDTRAEEIKESLNELINSSEGKESKGFDEPKIILVRKPKIEKGLSSFEDFFKDMKELEKTQKLDSMSQLRRDLTLYRIEELCHIVFSFYTK